MYILQYHTIKCAANYLVSAVSTVQLAHTAALRGEGPGVTAFLFPSLFLTLLAESRENMPVEEKVKKGNLD
jgi:hypothetical protein